MRLQRSLVMLALAVAVVAVALCVWGEGAEGGFVSPVATPVVVEGFR